MSPADIAYRRELADRIHDHLQQFLAAARMRAGIMRMDSREKNIPTDGIGEIERLLEKAMDESTDLIHELRLDGARDDLHQ